MDFINTKRPFKTEMNLTYMHILEGKILSILRLFGAIPHEWRLQSALSKFSCARVWFYFMPNLIVDMKLMPSKHFKKGANHGMSYCMLYRKQIHYIRAIFRIVTTYYMARKYIYIYINIYICRLFNWFIRVHLK